MGAVQERRSVMLKEWLLIAWTGTTSNFTVIATAPTHTACDQRRTEYVELYRPTRDITVICTQDLREGRSRYPSRPGSGGIAGK